MTSDDIQTLCVALGPGLIGLLIITIGSRFRVPRWRQRRIWCAALTFVLLQTALVIFACFVFGGGIRLNRFTIVAGSGLLAEGIALSLYGIQAFQREDATLA